MADVLSEEEIQRRLDSDPDFICLKRFDYSLKKLMERYPEGPPDHLIARAMGLSEEAARMFELRVIRRLRREMGVDPDTGE